jgi:hypothetical protein
VRVPLDNAMSTPVTEIDAARPENAILLVARVTPLKVIVIVVFTGLF